jgi:hypothetical protein
MRDYIFPLLALGLALTPARGVMAEGAGTAIAVLDFDYVDTSGEIRDQRQEHAARLAAFMHALRDDFGKAGHRVVEPVCETTPCSVADATPADLLAASRKTGADILLIGGIHKTSTLVQWARVEAINLKTGRLLADKLFTFRGDTDEAWRHSEKFIAKETLQISSKSGDGA